MLKLVGLKASNVVVAGVYGREVMEICAWETRLSSPAQAANVKLRNSRRVSGCRNLRVEGMFMVRDFRVILPRLREAEEFSGFRKLK